MLDSSFASVLKADSSDDHEHDRIAALTSYGILDTPPESQFDSVAELARVLFNAPMAAITLVDRDRQWFKSRPGMSSVQTAREFSFCSHAMESDTVFVVSDASHDPRFADNPLVTGAPNIRFYAGAALRSENGHNLGAVCVLSPEPRGDFSAEDQHNLEILARIVRTEMELKRHAQHVRKKLYDKDFALQEAHLRIKNSLEYANLMAEVQAADVSTEKLAALALAAWKQYTVAGSILSSSIKSLRDRMSSDEYKTLLGLMPGFAI